MKKIHTKMQHFVIRETSNQNILIQKTLSFGLCVTDPETAEDSTKHDTKPTDHCTLSSNKVGVIKCCSEK
jgi:hypothetical protein